MADTKISETTEFLTQIHTAWDGTEQRAALRGRPRRYLAYDYVGVRNWQSQYLRALAYTRQTQKIEFPLWHCAGSLKGTAYKGASALGVSADRLWGYRGAGGALLWADDELGGDRYGLRSLASDGTVGLTKQLTQNYPGGKTVVCPVAWGVLQQEDKFVNGSSQITSMTINVELIEDYQAPPFPPAIDEYQPELVQPPWGKNLPGTYQGAELFLLPPSWTKDMPASFKRNAARLDNQSGVFRYDLKSVDPTESREMDYVLTRRGEINNLQRFFYRCKGRLKSFWAPTWLSDMELAENAPAGQNYLLVNWSGYWQYYASTKRRRTLVAFANDGTAEILAIAGYSTDPTGELGKVYLDSELKRPLARNNTLMLSFLCRYRFDSDTLLVDYDTVNIANCATTLAEVTE